MSWWWPVISWHVTVGRVLPKDDLRVSALSAILRRQPEALISRLKILTYGSVGHRAMHFTAQRVASCSRSHENPNRARRELEISLALGGPGSMINRPQSPSFLVAAAAAMGFSRLCEAIVELFIRR